MNNISKNYTGIEYRPRSYDSKVDTQGQGSAQWLASSILGHLKSWIEANDQICFTRLDNRGIKQITSTGINKEDLDAFIHGAASREVIKSVKEFLKEATNDGIGNLNKTELKYISILIMEAPESLGFIKKLLTSPKLNELLPALATDSGRVIGLESSILETIISLDDARSIIKELGEYPLWRLNRNLLKNILTLPEAAKNLEVLKAFPKLSSTESEMIPKVLALEYPRFVLETLETYPELLENEKLTAGLLDKILESYCPSLVFKTLGEYPDLLKNEKLTADLWDKIWDSKDPRGVLEALGKYPDLLKNEKLTAGLLDKILDLKYPGDVLYVLREYPDLLKNEKLTSGHWDKILASQNPGKVLDTLGKYPDLLKNEKLTAGHWDKILASQDPEDVLNALGKYPDLLKNEKLTSGHLDKILDSQNPAYILDTLGKYPYLLKNEKLTSGHWEAMLSSPDLSKILTNLSALPDLLKDSVALDKVFSAKDILAALEAYRWGKYLKVSTEGYMLPHSNDPKVFLNQDLFLDDPSIKQWNVLTQREGPIDEKDWAIVQTNLADIFDSIYKERDNERERLFRFLGQCMGTADAKTPEGKQMIRKRVDAVVTKLQEYLEQMKTPDLTEEKREQLRKMIGSTLDEMAMGGSACPDNAIVLLRQAENKIKLFENPKYLANVIVNLFKLDSIAEKLIDKDNAENVETYLSYTLKLSKLLGLGISGSMLYGEHYGKTEPFEEALPKLSTAFTPEELIKFTVELPEFRSSMEDAKVKALAAKEQEYLDTYEMDDEGQAAQDRVRIDQELEDIKGSFYAKAARQLFLDAGFFATKKAD